MYMKLNYTYIQQQNELSFKLTDSSLTFIYEFPLNIEIYLKIRKIFDHRHIQYVFHLLEQGLLSRKVMPNFIPLKSLNSKRSMISE